MGDYISQIKFRYLHLYYYTMQYILNIIPDPAKIKRWVKDPIVKEIQSLVIA